MRCGTSTICSSRANGDRVVGRRDFRLLQRRREQHEHEHPRKAQRGREKDQRHTDEGWTCFGYSEKIPSVFRQCARGLLIARRQTPQYSSTRWRAKTSFDGGKGPALEIRPWEHALHYKYKARFVCKHLRKGF